MKLFLLVTALLSGMSFASQAKSNAGGEKKALDVVVASPATIPTPASIRTKVARIQDLYVVVWFSCGGYGTTYYGGNPTWEQICADAIAVDDEVCG